MIKVVDVYRKTFQNSIILLGFFDCLHIGHKALLNASLSFAEKHGLKVSMLTFRGGNGLLKAEEEGDILTLNERVQKAERLGVDTVITANFDEKFKNLSPKEFVSLLIENHSAKAFVCGYDFTYGKGAEGNAETLKADLKERNIPLITVEKQEFKGKRVSSSLIKKYLKDGKICEANKLLGEPYFITAKVEEGRKVGRDLGFPTANFSVPSGKMQIKDGVYLTSAVIGGKKFNGITNYGSKPTFSVDERTVETYFKGFQGDLYGEEITLSFHEFLREIKKFKDLDELKNQLAKDLERIK